MSQQETPCPLCAVPATAMGMAYIAPACQCTGVQAGRPVRRQDWDGATARILGQALRDRYGIKTLADLDAATNTTGESWNTDQNNKPPATC